MTRIGFAVLVACLACACAGPRPKAPSDAAVEAPASWHATQAKGSEPVDTQWWKQFDDPALDALVEQALARNVDLAIAAARVEEARAQYRFVAAQAGPDVAGLLSGAHQQTVSAFGRALNQTGGQAQVAAAYEVDLFGRLRASSAAAKANLLATAEARDTVRLAVASSTVGGYIGLRMLDARLELLRQTLHTREESLRVATRRADTGYGARLDQRQAEAEYHGAEQAIPATQLAIARQEDALRVLVGAVPGEVLRGQDLMSMHVPGLPDTGVPSGVLRTRPDVAQAEAQLVAADHSLDAARAAFMPRLNLSASVGYADADILSGGIRLFAIGGSVLVPIFQRGKLHAQADAAAARRDQAAWAYRRTVLFAFRDVEDALSAVAYTQQQEAALRAQRDAYAAAFTLARNRYRAGYSPYLEQLDASRNLLLTEVAYLNSRADRLAAMVALYQGLGGGWVPAEADVASDGGR